MTSHGYKQNEISQELSMGTKIFETRWHPFSTYAKFPEYLTPPLPFVRNCTIFWLPPPMRTHVYKNIL